MTSPQSWGLPATRACTGCGRTLPLTDEHFYRKTGPYRYPWQVWSLGATCKACTAAKSRSWERANAERRNERRRAKRAEAKAQALRPPAVLMTPEAAAAHHAVAEVRKARAEKLVFTKALIKHSARVRGDPSPKLWYGRFAGRTQAEKTAILKAEKAQAEAAEQHGPTPDAEQLEHLERMHRLIAENRLKFGDRSATKQPPPFCGSPTTD
ncbi:hypothetical protein WKW80_09275 [Variovorax humicola]|uniref:Uncharacterized protein n=1 Tax=Variovorax humicola TaxID=1769758 RepID=A0ABU8VYC8_9BURK